MSLDSILVQFRMLTQRLISTNQKKTQAMLLKRASTIAERSGYVRFLENTFVKKLSEQIGILNGYIVSQCNGMAAQRLRKTYQILLIYRKARGESFYKMITRRVGDPFNKSGKRMLVYGAALLSWQNQVTDSDLESCIDDMKYIERMVSSDQQNPDNDMKGGQNGNGNDNEQPNKASQYLNAWSCVINNSDFKIWSKPVEGSEVCEYKVYGTFTDISPRSFYKVQVDLNYRKKWDKRVLKLDVVDRDQDSGSEVVHWVTSFVWPMKNRDYVFVRRYKIDKERNVMVLMSHSTEYTSIPESKDCVRITKYESDMVIKPHSTFDENGLDYVLTYYDDPQTSLPNMTYNWLASKGVPDFLNQVHMAAKELQNMNINQNNINQGGIRDDSCNYTPIAQYC